MGVQRHFYVRNLSDIVGPNGSSQMFNEKVQKRLFLLYATTQQSCGRFIKFSNTIGHRPINELRCYEGNHTNTVFWLV